MGDAALKHFGRIDVLLNSGDGSLPGGPKEISVEEFRGQIDINSTDGAYRLIRRRGWR